MGLLDRLISFFKPDEAKVQQKNVDKMFSSYNKEQLDYKDVSIFVKDNKDQGFISSIFNNKKKTCNLFESLALDEDKFNFISNLDGEEGLSKNDMASYLAFDSKFGRSVNDDDVLDSSISLWEKNKNDMVGFDSDSESQIFAAKFAKNYLDLKDDSIDGNFSNETKELKNASLLASINGVLIFNVQEKGKTVDYEVDKSGEILSKSEYSKENNNTHITTTYEGGRVKSKLKKEAIDNNTVITSYGKNDEVESITKLTGFPPSQVEITKDGETKVFTQASDTSWEIFEDSNGKIYYYDDVKNTMTSGEEAEKISKDKIFGKDGAVELLKTYLSNQENGEININGFKKGWDFDYGQVSKLLDEFVSKDKISLKPGNEMTDANGIYSSDDKIAINLDHAYSTSIEDLASTLLHEIIHAQENRDDKYTDTLAQSVIKNGKFVDNAMKKYELGMEMTAFEEQKIFQKTHNDFLLDDIEKQEIPKEITEVLKLYQ